MLKKSLLCLFLSTIVMLPSLAFADEGVASNNDPCSLPGEAGEKMDKALASCFEKAEAIHKQIESVKIERVQGDKLDYALRDALEKQTNLVWAVSGVYQKIASHGEVPSLAISAMIQLGCSFDDVYKTLQNAPVPADLLPEVEFAYRELLAEHAAAFKTRAVEYYGRALKVAEEKAIKNEYTTKAEERLAKLKDAK